MREQTHWDVELVGIENQQTYHHKVSTYWDSAAEDAEDAVKNTAQAEAYVKSGKQQRFVPVSAKRVNE